MGGPKRRNRFSRKLADAPGAGIKFYSGTGNLRKKLLICPDQNPKIQNYFWTWAICVNLPSKSERQILRHRLVAAVPHGHFRRGEIRRK